VEYLSQKYPLVLISVVFVVTMMLVGIPVSKLLSKDPYQQSIYKYSMVTPNYGYVGYALAGSIFGDEMLLNVMMFALPLSIYTYTIGYCMLTRSKVSWKKLMSPANIALLLGAVVGLLDIPMPSLVTSFLGKASGCMGPISMLLTGMVIAEYKLIEMFTNKVVYLLGALRLLIIPIATAGLLVLLGMKELMPPVLVILSVPCGMNTIVFPKLVGEDCKTGAALTCVTSILCCLTIPFCLWLFGVSA
jgi:predicted permease